MSTIAEQRIKREFKEVVKSDEVHILVVHQSAFSRHLKKLK